MSMDENRVAVAALLAEHTYIPSALRGVSRCVCGLQCYGMPHEHRFHVAELIATRLAELEAEIRNLRAEIEWRGGRRP